MITEKKRGTGKTGVSFEVTSQQHSKRRAVGCVQLGFSLQHIRHVVDRLRRGCNIRKQTASYEPSYSKISDAAVRVKWSSVSLRQSGDDHLLKAGYGEQLVAAGSSVSTGVWRVKMKRRLSVTLSKIASHKERSFKVCGQRC